ncbi:hypothetical protein HUJ05_003639 [Dendroctonus ponderosae]|nr:hypothetical protein HUJ05_003639 [Dendroctonus ponderosae]
MISLCYKLYDGLQSVSNASNASKILRCNPQLQEKRNLLITLAELPSKCQDLFVVVIKNLNNVLLRSANDKRDHIAVPAVS